MGAKLSYTDYNQFPNISFEEFQSIPYIQERKEIARRNKILRTDTYNRTMDYTKGEKGNQIETFYGSFRRSPQRFKQASNDSNKIVEVDTEESNQFNVIYGVKRILDEVLRNPITQKELDFAKDYYKYQDKKGGQGKFNAARWQRVIDEHNGMLPLKISAVEDGTVLKGGEPILKVEGEAELAAVFEPIFIRLFYQSVIATNARFIEELIGSNRLVEFGYRGAVNDDMHMDAMEALQVGGAINRTSADVDAAALDLFTEGTTAHRFFTAYTTEDEAMVEAIEKNDRVALLVDSVESFKGIDKVIALKKKYKNTNKIINPRLDSGDLVAQTIYTLKAFKKAGFTDPSNKIIVEDISSISDILEIEIAVKEAGFNPEDYIIYGLGSLLIAKDKTRDVVASVFKLSNTEDGGTMKIAKGTGKDSIPGSPNVEIIDGKRYTVQEDEEVQGVRLLTPMYDNGEFFYDRATLEDIPKARKRMLETREYTNHPATFSQETQNEIEKFKKRIGSI